MNHDDLRKPAEAASRSQAVRQTSSDAYAARYESDPADPACAADLAIFRAGWEDARSALATPKAETVVGIVEQVEACVICGEGQARLIRSCDVCTSEYAGVNETRRSTPATKAEPAPAVAIDERAAYVNWLHGTYPRSYSEEDAEHNWRHEHVSALAWQARAALAATPAEHTPAPSPHPEMQRKPLQVPDYWPIARVTVNDTGAEVEMMAPGLPNGVHELYLPEDALPPRGDMAFLAGFLNNHEAQEVKLAVRRIVSWLNASGLARRRAAEVAPAHALDAQTLLAALQRAHDWMDSQADAQSKGGHATFDLMMLREERDAAAEAIAAQVAQKGGEA